jgi:hypothetical protein
VVEFFRILGQRDVPLEKLPETLTQIATRHREMLVRLAALDPEDPGVREQVEEARVAIKAGDYDRADRLLSEAENSDLAAFRMAQELARQAQESAEKRQVSAAAMPPISGAIISTVMPERSGITVSRRTITLPSCRPSTSMERHLSSCRASAFRSTGPRPKTTWAARSRDWASGKSSLNF